MAWTKWLPPNVSVGLSAEHGEAGLSLDALHGDPVDGLLLGTARRQSMVPLKRDAQLLRRAPPLLGPPAARSLNGG